MPFRKMRAVHAMNIALFYYHPSCVQPRSLHPSLPPCISDAIRAQIPCAYLSSYLSAPNRPCFAHHAFSSHLARRRGFLLGAPTRRRAPPRHAAWVQPRWRVCRSVRRWGTLLRGRRGAVEGMCTCRVPTAPRRRSMLRAFARAGRRSTVGGTAASCIAGVGELTFEVE